MVCAYVLIRTALGKAITVVEAVSKIEGVKNASAVTGAYDVVAVIEVDKVSDIAELVVNKIHRVDGVCNTQTLICVTKE